MAGPKPAESAGEPGMTSLMAPSLPSEMPANNSCPYICAAPRGLSGAPHFVGVRQRPATVLDAAERGVRRDGIDAVLEKLLPIGGRNLIQGFNHLVKIIGDDLGGGTAAAVKLFTEIIE